MKIIMNDAKSPMVVYTAINFTKALIEKRLKHLIEELPEHDESKKGANALNSDLKHLTQLVKAIDPRIWAEPNSYDEYPYEDCHKTHKKLTHFADQVRDRLKSLMDLVPNYLRNEPNCLIETSEDLVRLVRQIDPSDIEHENWELDLAEYYSWARAY